MTEPRLRSRTTSEIVDAAFALYRRDFGQYVVVMAFAMLPQLIANILLRGDKPPSSVGGALSTLLILFASMLTTTIGSAAVMKLGSEVYLGESADLEATVKGVIPRLWSLIGAAFLKSLAFTAGFLCFFVGIFYVLARFFAVEAAVILEGKSAAGAFGRSSELSIGLKRHVLNTLILVGIVYFILLLCVTVAATMLGSTVLTLIASTLFIIVAYPMFGLTQMVLYYDARIRNEGFDLERMAASIDGAGPGAPSMAGGTN